MWGKKLFCSWFTEKEQLAVSVPEKDFSQEYEALGEVGSAKKQGICVRCGQEKEVILFNKSCLGVNDKTVGVAAAYVCNDCFAPAVSESRFARGPRSI